jgi:hypothetical protein
MFKAEAEADISQWDADLQSMCETRMIFPIADLQTTAKQQNLFIHMFNKNLVEYSGMLWSFT